MPALVGGSDVRHQTAAVLRGNGFQFVPCAGEGRTDFRLFDCLHHSLQVVKQILLRVQAILEDGLQFLAVKSGEIAAHKPECSYLAAVVPNRLIPLGRSEIHSVHSGPTDVEPVLILFALQQGRPIL